MSDTYCPRCGGLTGTSYICMKCGRDCTPAQPYRDDGVTACPAPKTPFDNVDIDWWAYPMCVIKTAFFKYFDPTDENAWNEFKRCLAEASRGDSFMHQIGMHGTADDQEEQK